jgi:hypothetical protein
MLPWTSEPAATPTRICSGRPPSSASWALQRGDALHLEAAADGGVGEGGEVLAAVGGDEDDHDAVADALVDDAAVVEDDGVDGARSRC